MTGTLVDTDILIDAARDLEAAIHCLEQLERTSILAVSVITEMELLVGCRSKAELKSTDHFLKRFQIIPLSPPICELAVHLVRRYRLSHGLLIGDSLIAATAISTSNPFITKNQRDFVL